jgi:hypothetical protein
LLSLPLGFCASGELVDRSEEWIRSVLEKDGLQQLPHIAQLREYMRKVPGKLVFSDRLLPRIQGDWQKLCVPLSEFYAPAVALELDNILTCKFRTEGNWTEHAVNSSVVAVLEMLDESFAPPLQGPWLSTLQVKCVIERDRGHAIIRMKDGIGMLSKIIEKGPGHKVKVTPRIDWHGLFKKLCRFCCNIACHGHHLLL